MTDNSYVICAKLQISIKMSFDIIQDWNVFDLIRGFLVDRNTPICAQPIARDDQPAVANTLPGYMVGPRLREPAARGQREPGGGIHAT